MKSLEQNVGNLVLFTLGCHSPGLGPGITRLIDGSLRGQATCDLVLAPYLQTCEACNLAILSVYLSIGETGVS